MKHHLQPKSDTSYLIIKQKTITSNKFKYTEWINMIIENTHVKSPGKPTLVGSKPRCLKHLQHDPMHSRQRSSDSNARDVVCGLSGSFYQGGGTNMAGWNLFGGWTNPCERNMIVKVCRSFPQVGRVKWPFERLWKSHFESPGDISFQQKPENETGCFVSETKWMVGSCCVNPVSMFFVFWRTWLSLRLSDVYFSCVFFGACSL